METGKGTGGGSSNLQKGLYNPWGVELVVMCKMLHLPNTANITLMWLMSCWALAGCFPKWARASVNLRIIYEAAICPSFGLCALFSLPFPLQLRQSQDWEAVGRKLVRVLDQDGLLLGLSLPLHVDPHRSHGLPQALCSLGRPPRLLGFSGRCSADAATLNRGISTDGPLPWNTTPYYYSQHSKWSIICCLLLFTLVFLLCFTM